MRSRAQRGEGKLSGIVWLLVILGLGYAGIKAGPVYIANYALKDKMNEICRTPRAQGDEKVREQLMKYVKQEGLDGYVQSPMFKISTLETGRRITIDYTREVEFLPGFKRKVQFVNDVEQPLIY